MSRTELIKAIHFQSGCKKADVERIVKTTFDAIGTQLAKGEKVSIDKFGTFKVQSVAAHMASNPLTQAVVDVPAHKKVVFVAAPTLKGVVDR